MNWHDAVFTIGTVIFILALIPMAWNVDTTVPFKSSLSTGLVLAVFAVNLLSLGLYFSAAAEVITASLWLFIAARRPA